MVSNSDITLYFMQEMASLPSAHPDLISSTKPSIGVPFQKAVFAGWATAEPKRAKARMQNTLADIAAFCLHVTVVLLTVGRIELNY